MSKNFEAFLRLSKKGLENKYVIIINGTVVAKGKDIEKMLNRVKRKYPHETPFVAKIPDESMLILWSVINLEWMDWFWGLRSSAVEKFNGKNF